ncbi:MAG: hypothetical protein Q7J16_07745 [Candidatus Cloacimonadales bacterium]|nr:hypothetical protein [Candidatus Cloacimonadales bacterium]
MKKLIILVFGIMLIMGCGADGKDGKAYLRITWDWYVDSFYDNNPDTPYNVYEDTYYETDPGSYTYSYDCSDGLGNYWSYSGTYTITIDKGEKGGLFTAGEDGEDSYFYLDLTGYASRDNSNDNSTSKSKKTELNRDNEINLSLYEKIKISDMKSETFYSGNYRMDVSKQMYQLKKK